MTSKRFAQHFNICQIVYNFTIIELNHLKLCMWIQTNKLKNIVQVLWSLR